MAQPTPKQQPKQLHSISYTKTGIQSHTEFLHEVWEGTPAEFLIDQFQKFPRHDFAIMTAFPITEEEALELQKYV